MELMTLRQLAKHTDRAFASLKRHAERDTIPRQAGSAQGYTNFTKDPVYGENAVEYVNALRRNVRKPKDDEPVEEEPSEMDKRVDAVLTAALRAATGAAITFLRHEVESARAGKEWEYESRLHGELARMLSELAAEGPSPVPEVVQ